MLPKCNLPIAPWLLKNSKAHETVLKSRLVDSARQLPEDGNFIDKVIYQASVLRVSRHDQRYLADILIQGEVHEREQVQWALSIISYHVLTNYCAKDQPELSAERLDSKNKVDHKYYLPRNRIRLMGWLNRTSAQMLLENRNDLIRACIPSLKDWGKITRYASHFRVDRHHQRRLAKLLNDMNYWSEQLVRATIGVVAANVYGGLDTGFVPNFIPNLEKIQTKLSSKR